MPESAWLVFLQIMGMCCNWPLQTGAKVSTQQVQWQSLRKASNIQQLRRYVDSDLSALLLQLLGRIWLQQVTWVPRVTLPGRLGLLGSFLQCRQGLSRLAYFDAAWQQESCPNCWFRTCPSSMGSGSNLPEWFRHLGLLREFIRCRGGSLGPVPDRTQCGAAGQRAGTSSRGRPEC